MAESVDSTSKAPEKAIGGLSLRNSSVLMGVLLAVVVIVFLLGLWQIDGKYSALLEATNSYSACENAANDMREGSNYLTSQIRQFVITHDVKYLDNYFTEANEVQRRDKAVALLDSYAGSKPAHEFLEQSRDESNMLMRDELYAARLVLDATDTEPNKGASEMAAVVLSEEDQALSADEKLVKSLTLVFGDTYQEHVRKIEDAVAQCRSSLIADLQEEQQSLADETNNLLRLQRILAVVLLVLAILLIIGIVVLVLNPIRGNIKRLAENRALPITGANELRFLAQEYNALHEKNLKYSADLRRRAEHDHLTGLYNRSEFDRLLEAYQSEDVALLIIDADNFKTINDTLGHDTGDRILQKLAKLLISTFRASDFTCRIGGDEFAVIMTEMNPGLSQVVESKIATLVAGMADDSDGLPSTTLSIGIAFNDGTSGSETIFKHADEALYRAKNAGRNGYRFY